MIRTRSRPITLLSLVALVSLVASAGQPGCALAEEKVSIDLSAANAAGDWFFYATTGTDGAPSSAPSGAGHGKIEDGQLVLDGRQVFSHALFKPRAWKDVSLSAKFCVDPSSQGVQACGFVLRATDMQTYYYVHFDRGQAILVRCSPEASWIEIKRVSGLNKPAGTWHEGRLDCQGDKLTVWLNGQKLYEVQDAAIGSAGRIGFYAGQGLVRVKDIVVTGASTAEETPLRIPPPQFVHVCTDGGAGAYEAFPDVCRLADGRLISVFYASYGHVGVPNDKWPRGGRISYCTSEDEGRTWSEAKTLLDTPDDDRDPSLTQLASGRLICTYFNIPSGTWIVVSDDGGKTWGEPRHIAPDYYVSSPVRELSDGSLILGLYYERGNTASGAVIKSVDGGQTWGKVVEIDNAGRRLDAETDVIELSDGSLFAALRGHDGMCWSKSTDDGQTWSPAAPFSRPGHCPYLHRAVTGEVLLAHRLPMSSLSISTDEGQTWAEPILIDGLIGAYPAMVNLKDGSVLVVYYEEGDGSNIRARRFRVKGSTVEWLPPADEAVAALPAPKSKKSP